MRRLIIGILMCVGAWGALYGFISSLTDEDLAGGTAGLDLISVVLLAIGIVGLVVTVQSIKELRANKREKIK